MSKQFDLEPHEYRRKGRLLPPPVQRFFRHFMLWATICGVWTGAAISLLPILPLPKMPWWAILAIPFGPSLILLTLAVIADQEARLDTGPRRPPPAAVRLPPRQSVSHQQAPLSAPDDTSERNIANRYPPRS